MFAWNVTKASVIGAAHIKENLPCQDANGYKYFPEEDFGIAVVSDGAGSAEFSHLGSGKVVEYAIGLFSELIVNKAYYSNPPSQMQWKDDTITAFREIYMRLKLFAEQEFIPVKSLAATVIVLIHVPYGMLVAHIGDGRSGYLDGNNEWLPCIIPFKGELVNETIFITSDIWEKENISDFIGSDVIENSIKAFTLLTDGCENVCFDLKKLNSETGSYEMINKPFRGFYDYNIEVLNSLLLSGFSEKEIDALWENFLQTGMESFVNEPDDKTLILGIKYVANAK